MLSFPGDFFLLFFHPLITIFFYSFLFTILKHGKRIVKKNKNYRKIQQVNLFFLQGNGLLTAISLLLKNHISYSDLYSNFTIYDSSLVDVHFYSCISLRDAIKYRIFNAFDCTFICFQLMMDEAAFYSSQYFLLLLNFSSYSQFIYSVHANMILMNTEEYGSIPYCISNIESSQQYLNKKKVKIIESRIDVRGNSKKRTCF